MPGARSDSSHQRAAGTASQVSPGTGTAARCEAAAGLPAVARDLPGQRLGSRGWEVLSAARHGEVEIPAVSRSVDEARLRAARRMRRLGLLQPASRAEARRVRLTQAGERVVQEVVERRRAGVDVRWASVLASLRDRFGVEP